MKARVKATGKIVEISTFQDDNKFPTTYDENELEFLIPNDYWTHLEHIYAGMAMQGLMRNVKQITPKEGRSFRDEIVDISSTVAHTLVEKYKKEEK